MTRLYFLARSRQSRIAKLFLELQEIPYEEVDVEATGLLAEIDHLLPVTKLPALEDNGKFFEGMAGIRLFAQERAAQIAVQICKISRQVERLNVHLPPEEVTGEINLIPISFEDGVEESGLAALYFAGDFYKASKDRTVRFIRPRTQEILDIIGVPYQVVTPRV
jgi:hypothetical protein